MLALLTQTLMSFKRTTLPSIPEEAAEPSDTTSLTAVITGRLQTHTPTASWIISLVNLKSTAPPRNSQGVVVLRGQLALAPECEAFLLCNSSWMTTDTAALQRLTPS